MAMSEITMKKLGHNNSPNDATLRKQRQRERAKDSGKVRIDRMVDRDLADYARFVLKVLQRPNDKYRQRLIRQLNILMDCMGEHMPDQAIVDGELVALVEVMLSDQLSSHSLATELSLLKAAHKV